MITKDELAAMIAALESQPHLSIKEEKYLKLLWAYVKMEGSLDYLRNQNIKLWAWVVEAEQRCKKLSR